MISEVRSPNGIIQAAQEGESLADFADLFFPGLLLPYQRAFLDRPDPDLLAWTATSCRPTEISELRCQSPDSGAAVLNSPPPPRAPKAP